MPGLFGNLAAFLTQLLLPTRCIVCQQLGAEVFCSSCKEHLQYLDPHCLNCGRLRQTSFFSPDCGECHGHKLGVKRARSILLYNACGRKILAEYKYKSKDAAGRELQKIMVAWLQRDFNSRFDRIASSGAADLDLLPPDAIVAVPLHQRKLKERRFNQAEYLAQCAAQQWGLPLFDPLVRSRETESQVGKSMTQRLENVRGAFEVPERRKDSVDKKVLLIVDDVMTTGATLHACATALRKAGATACYGLTMFSTSQHYEPASRQMA